jgi:hypothetical protein
MKKIDLYIDDDSYKKLAELVSMGLNKSEIIRQAIKAHLNSEYIKHLTEVINEKAK